MSLPKRVFFTALAIFAVLWLVGISYVLAVNGSLRLQRDAPAIGTCEGPPQPNAAPNPPFQPHTDASGTLRLQQALGDPVVSGLPQWPGLIDVTPKAFDFDGDGVDELIAHSNDTNVYVFDSETGRVLARLPTTCPHGWYIERILNGVEAAVLRPGEPPSLVVTNHAAFVTVWRLVPEQSDSDHLVFERVWEVRVNECFEDAGMDAKPTLADLNGDGNLEILVQTEEMGFFALNTDGTKLWGQCWGGGNSEPVAHDLDGDGDLEAIFASDGGFVAVLEGATGKPQWTFNARDHGIFPASIPVSPTVAELDGRLPRELLFTARHAPAGDPTLYSTFHMAIFAIHQNTTTWQTEMLWMRQPDWAHPLSYTRLVVADVDADGSPDIFGMDWNTIGHSPGKWELLGPAHAFRLNSRGEDVWVRDVDSWWSNKDILVGDSDLDGRPDLLVNAAKDGLDGLMRLSADTGEPLNYMAVWPWKVMRGPTLLDLHHDGSPEIVYPAAPDVLWPSHGSLFVFQFDPA